MHFLFMRDKILYWFVGWQAFIAQNICPEGIFGVLECSNEGKKYRILVERP